MTHEELEILRNTASKEFIEEHLHKDPAQLALQKSYAGLPLALLSTQIKYLQKSREKLPTYFQRRCIFHPKAYEQCSSEKSAEMRGEYQGITCLDLTCGLGVDSWAFSRHFQAVTALEREPGLAALADYNFSRLERTNIQVKNIAAEDFLQAYKGPPFDLIFLDPDRRPASSQQKIRLEDCSPNVFEILPKLLELGTIVLIKISPLFDLNEIERIFPSISNSIVVSINNECKEVLLEFQSRAERSYRRTIWINRENQKATYSFDPLESPKPIPAFPATIKYIYEPDVAFYQARCTIQLMNDYYPQLTGTFNDAMGYFFSEERIESFFPGRIFAVKEAFMYKPQLIRKRLASLHGTSLHITQRHFPQNTQAIRKQLGLKEGGDDFLICTKMNSNFLSAFLAERIA